MRSARTQVIGPEMTDEFSRYRASSVGVALPARRAREAPCLNGLVSHCRVEDRYCGGGDQPGAKDQIAKLSEWIEVDRCTAVSDQGCVRQNRHAQHVVGQHQQHSGGTWKTTALLVRPT